MRAKGANISVGTDAPTRRGLLAILAAMGVAGVSRHALALAPAQELSEVWPEVLAGDFTTAAARLDLHVTEWPLDHKARINPPAMQFAAGAFENAIGHLEREVHLRRGYARSRPTSTDFDWPESLLYLSRLRAGVSAEIPQPQYNPSLLSLLNNDITLDGFLQRAYAAKEIEYAEIEQMMGLISKAVGQTDKQAALWFTYTRPDPQVTNKELICTARLILGEQALGNKDAKAARWHLQTAIETGIDYLLGFHVAKAELARLS